MEPRSITWIANKVYHLPTEADFRVGLITSETRMKLTRNAEVDEISVTLAMVDGRDQFKEEEVIIKRSANKREIIDAW
jgi:hypothetical protein